MTRSDGAARPVKNISILKSLSFGFRLTLRHWHRLIPLCVVFYFPDLLKKAGVDGMWAGIAGQVFKVFILLFMLITAIRVANGAEGAKAAPAAGKPSTLNFLVSTGLFWSGVLLLAAPSCLLAFVFWQDQCGSAAAMPGSLSELASRLGSAPLKSLLKFTAGALLLLVPCAIWAIRFWFFGYFVADRGVSVLDSFRMSWAITRGVFLEVSWFCVVLGILISAAFALYVVPVFFVFPATLIATSYVYLELRRQTPGIAEM